MKMNPAVTLSVIAALATLGSCGGQPPASTETASIDAGEWTDENFPSYIRRITYFGQRADWSHDGKRILFMEKTYGDVYEIDLETERIRPMTHHYYHHGYTRALYLSNGDIILSGSRTFDPENHRAARAKTAELWVLSKDLDKPPVPLGEGCSEGIAVSRNQLRISWAVDDENESSGLPENTSQIWMADIDYSSGPPKLANKRLLVDSRRVDYGHDFETQNFVPPDDTKLVWTAYRWRGTEVMMLDIETGENQNMSNADIQYDEPEGIFPDGKHTLVECDKHTAPDFQGSDKIDLWKLALDGSGDYQRITKFNDGGRFKASNPVVSDDGRYIAFQVPKTGLIAGVGLGLYIFDLDAAGLR